jgi:hypothetical protein
LPPGDATTCSTDEYISSPALLVFPNRNVRLQLPAGGIAAVQVFAVMEKAGGPPT